MSTDVKLFVVLVLTVILIATAIIILHQRPDYNVTREEACKSPFASIANNYKTDCAKYIK